jgi:sigma-B regulation protein RsbU (phosphoserine phosphatase)
VKFDPGDFLLIYSDGVSDAVNKEGELFEEMRLREIIGEFQGEMAREFAAAIWEALKTFTAGAPQCDDITVLVVQYKGSAPDDRGYIGSIDLLADDAMKTL